MTGRAPPDGSFGGYRNVRMNPTLVRVPSAPGCLQGAGLFEPVPEESDDVAEDQRRGAG